MRVITALGKFLNAKPFLWRHQKEGVGMLHGHDPTNGPEGVHEQQAFAESETARPWSRKRSKPDSSLAKCAQANI